MACVRMSSAIVAGILDSSFIRSDILAAILQQFKWVKLKVAEALLPHSRQLEQK